MIKYLSIIALTLQFVHSQDFVICQIPVIEGAQFRFSGGLLEGGSYMLNGDVVEMSCPGSASPVPPRSKCQSNQWSPAFGSCQTPNGCNRNPSAANGIILPGSSATGSYRRVRCNSGYQLSGRSFIKCQNNGTWTVPGICRGKRIANSTTTTTALPTTLVQVSSNRTNTCIGTLFPCNNGRCVNREFRCDGENDCGDFSDEICSPIECPGFSCSNRRCIPSYKMCDGNNDCGDNSDELSEVCPSTPDFYTQCPAVDHWQCRNLQCIRSEFKCDTQRDCDDGSDENNCTTCQGFHCRNRKCIPSDYKCDGDDDCTDGSDESKCVWNRQDLITQTDLFAFLISETNSTISTLRNFLANNTININTHELFVERFCRYYLPNATLLHVATACNKSLEFVKFLYENGATDINRRDTSEKAGSVPLHFAAAFDNSQIVTYLLGKGARPNIGSYANSTALHFAADKGSLQTVKTLLQVPGIDIDARNKNADTPLMIAAARNHVRIIRVLINGSASQSGCRHYLCSNGLTPKTNLLIFAVMDRNISALEGVLSRNSVVVDTRGYCSHSQNATALTCAALIGESSFVAILIANGANIEARDNVGGTPLIWAAQNGHYASVEMLLDNGANINADNIFGDTALMFSAKNGHLDVVKLLVRRGANKYIRQLFGKTAEMIARDGGYYDIADFLALS